MSGGSSVGVSVWGGVRWVVCWEITVGWGQVSGVLGNHCGVGSGGSCAGVSLLGSGEWCVGVSVWGGVR